MAAYIYMTTVNKLHDYGQQHRFIELLEYRAILVCDLLLLALEAMYVHVLYVVVLLFN